MFSLKEGLVFRFHDQGLKTDQDSRIQDELGVRDAGGGRCVGKGIMISHEGQNGPRHQVW